MVSCTYLSKARDYQPCHFDRVNLTVIGSDIDFKDSIVINNGNILGCISTNTDEKNVDYKVMPYNHLLNKPMSTKICFCRDTIWAKKQIFSELKRRYSFNLKDSIENYREYKAIVIDSSKFIRTKEPFGTFVVGSNELYFYMKNLNYHQLIGEAVSIVCGSKENKFYICSLANSPSNDKFNEQYDLNIRKEFHYLDYKYGLSDKTIGETTNYILDSLGIQIEIVAEYSKPIKLIKFNSNL
jgi:hypothetical protein